MQQDYTTSHRAYIIEELSKIAKDEDTFVALKAYVNRNYNFWIARLLQLWPMSFECYDHKMLSFVASIYEGIFFSVDLRRDFLINRLAGKNSLHNINSKVISSVTATFNRKTILCITDNRTLSSEQKILLVEMLQNALGTGGRTQAEVREQQLISDIKKDAIEAYLEIPKLLYSDMFDAFFDSLQIIGNSKIIELDKIRKILERILLRAHIERTMDLMENTFNKAVLEDRHNRISRELADNFKGNACALDSLGLSSTAK